MPSQNCATQSAEKPLPLSFCSFHCGQKRKPYRRLHFSHNASSVSLTASRFPRTSNSHHAISSPLTFNGRFAEVVHCVRTIDLGSSRNSFSTVNSSAGISIETLHGNPQA